MGWRLAPADDPWPRPGRGGRRLALEGVWPWLALIVVAVAWDGLGIDTGTHEAHLTLSALAQTYRPMNAGLLLVWILVGVGYGAAPRPGAPRASGPDRNGRAGWRGATGRRHGAGNGAQRQGRPSCCPRAVPWASCSGSAVPVVAILIDLVARRSGGRMAKADEFVRFISTAQAANVALILAWTFAGYHLFAR